jgi:hypothetical protein
VAYRSYGGPQFYESLAQFILIGLLLVMRGDIARWCVRPVGAEADARPRRQAALYPWLSLLGVLLVMDAARPLVYQGLTRAGMLSEAPMPAGQGIVTIRSWPPFWVPLAAGLILLLARRPLARLLAYGPLLQRRTIRHGLKSD